MELHYCMGWGKRRGAGVMVMLIMTMMKMIMTDIY